MSLRRSLQRAAATTAATVVPLAAAAVIAPADARAPRLSNTSTPTYQTNGRVTAILVVRNTVYIGGDFTAVRPPGVDPGTREVPRAHAAAFRLDNGKLRAWNPHPNGSVAALAASSDRHSIYIGGGFTTLAGAPRHHLGAVDAKTGSVTGFRANTNGAVLALARSGSRLYLGGDFDIAKHRARHHVAAVGANGHLVRSWHPGTDGTVRSIRLAVHGTRVYLGGAFKSVNGHPGQFLAKLSSSGKLLPWRRHPGHTVWSLVVASGHVYAGGNGPGGYVTAFSRRGGGAWTVRTDGGVQSLAWFHGRLIVGGHFRHFCNGMAGHRCATVLADRNKLAALNADTGAVLPWHPSANSGLGVFALRSAGSKVYVGGVFTEVNNVPQQGFDSFSQS